MNAAKLTDAALADEARDGFRDAAQVNDLVDALLAASLELIHASGKPAPVRAAAVALASAHHERTRAALLAGLETKGDATR